MRRGILEAVRARPGQGAAELASALGSDWKTVVHHARVLAALGHLEVRAEGRRRWFFPVEGPAAAKDALAAAAGATAAKVLALALDRPGASMHELATALDLPASTLRWHVARLAQRGLLREAGAGWAVPPERREAVRMGVGMRCGKD